MKFDIKDFGDEEKQRSINNFEGFPVLLPENDEKTNVYVTSCCKAIADFIILRHIK